MKKSLKYLLLLIFSFGTVYLMIFAFWHRTNSELLFLILSAYALAAVILSFLFVLYSRRINQRKTESANRRLVRLVNNLSAPAMLWDDELQSVIMNEKLRTLAELENDPQEKLDAKQMIPWLFGKKQLGEEELKEIIRAKNQDYSFVGKRGTQRDMIWNTSSLLTDENGVSKFLTIGLDLAEIRTMQTKINTYSKRLAAAEGKHALSMELTEIGILIGEQGSDQIFLSAEMRKMLGYDKEIITVDELRKHVFDADLFVYDQHMKSMKDHMEDYLDEIHMMELRLCGKDSQYRWYLYRFKATRMKDSNQLVVGGALLDNTREKEKDVEIERIAYQDSVTKIHNRNKMMMMGTDLYQCIENTNLSYWVIVTDIDRFHIINDTCGYDSGNELLKSFSEAISATLNLGGFAARISGDNFALILRATGDDTLPKRIIQKIQTSLAALAVGKFANRSLTCSAGYAMMPRDGKNFEEVLEHAEFALSAESQTMGSISAYTKEMHDTILFETGMERKLVDAVKNHQLLLHYQPKINLADGKIMGLEALVRWQQPDGTLLNPANFIPIAEKSLVITQITDFVLRETCSQMAEWQEKGLPQLVVSINMSSTDFYQENLPRKVMALLEANQIPPQNLEIELTESLALNDIDLTIAQMKLLREAGIQLAMDDFGTGYSSLSYIQKLPFTMLKLDQNFVKHMENDPVVQEIVSSVVRIAKAKNISTIAEGVETEDQAKQLRLCGCDYAQGFLYGGPMTADDIERFIRKNQESHPVY